MGQAHKWFLPAKLCNLLAGSGLQAFPLAKGSPADQLGFLLPGEGGHHLKPQRFLPQASYDPLSCLLKPLMTLCLTRPAPSPVCHIQFVWRIFSSWLLMLVFSCRKARLFSHHSRLDSPVPTTTCIQWWLVSPRILIHSALFQKRWKVFLLVLYKIPTSLRMFLCSLGSQTEKRIRFWLICTKEMCMYNWITLLYTWN